MQKLCGRQIDDRTDELQWQVFVDIYIYIYIIYIYYLLWLLIIFHFFHRSNQDYSVLLMTLLFGSGNFLQMARGNFNSYENILC